MDLEISNKILETDIGKLALDPKYGDANFSSSLEYLKSLQDNLSELISNDFESFFTTNDLTNIENVAKQFSDFLNQFDTFDPKNSDFSTTRTTFENNVKSFYENNIGRLRNDATILYHDREKSKPDNQRVQSLLNDLHTDKIESEKIITEYKEELERLKAGNIKKTKSGVLELGGFFSEQADKHSGDVANWLWWRRIILGMLFLVLIVVIVLIFSGFKFIPNECRKDTYCLVQFSVTKIFILSLLTYMLSFYSKNFDISSSLFIVNKHRSNVAQTIDKFLSLEQSEDVRSEIIRQGVATMFTQVPDGYLTTKDRKNELNIVGDVINKIPKDILKQ